MDFGYSIGDRVIQIDDKVIGEVVKFYTSTACKQQTMILCDDGRKYHAPSDTMAVAMPLAEDLAQPLLVPHDYRNIKVTDGMTITIDLEKLKKQLAESHYPRIELNYGA